MDRTDPSLFTAGKLLWRVALCFPSQDLKNVCFRMFYSEGLLIVRNIMRGLSRPKNHVLLKLLSKDTVAFKTTSVARLKPLLKSA